MTKAIECIGLLLLVASAIYMGHVWLPAIIQFILI